MAYTNSFGTKSQQKFGNKSFQFHSLRKLADATKKDLTRLPFSLKILLENLLRFEDGVAIKKADVEAILNWKAKADPDREIQFTPGRVVLQDFTGVPCVADLAAMRSAVVKLGGKASRINPLQPVALVIDHSVQVDVYGKASALAENTAIEFDRNKERYLFLKWGQKALSNFSAVPPGTGIVHQVNLEYLAQLAMDSTRDDGEWIYPDSLVGTDSHTTMINGLGVLGWGVGGIEAEAAMLGQPITMLIPQVVGFKLNGRLNAGATATDLVLTVTQMLRKKGVVGKFVEFYGAGLKDLSLADRATIANMAPEYGATVGLFPIDEQTTNYLRTTNRAEYADRSEAYYKEQGLWYSPSQKDPEFSDTLELDLASVEPSMAGPARPQDRVTLTTAPDSLKKSVIARFEKQDSDKVLSTQVPVKDPSGQKYSIGHGSVVIAAITSCTNTSNPSVMVAAGLLAKKAVEKGLSSKPFVKTSLAPGSKVVTAYLVESGLMPYLEKVGFFTVGYGCTTCIGNSGPLPEHVVEAIKTGDLSVAGVLSGNRNFEGRVNQHVRANYLASPPLVVAYALAGSLQLDMTKEPIGKGKDGKDVWLKDIWPTPKEVSDVVEKFVTATQFKNSYADVFAGSADWKALNAPTGELYQFDPKSTYIKEPPFFENMSKIPEAVHDIVGARVLGLFGDSITTDHISPAGGIAKDSPAAKYLMDNGVQAKDFNQYGARRGNHEVMVRGTFANIRIKNLMVPGVEGGVTVHKPSNKQMTIYDAAMEYEKTHTPLVILAGKEYGTGSSRDWAAKGTKLLGVRAVITESFERIHRSNLVGMGVLPLQFINGESAATFGLTGDEVFEIKGLSSMKPGQKVSVLATKPDKKTVAFEVLSRIDTANEMEYYKNGGILNYVLRQIATK
jgi:aconitate hydratase